MKHRKLLTVGALGLILSLSVAVIGLSAPKGGYWGNVNFAIYWFGQNTPSGSKILSITEPAFEQVNQTFPDHSGVYDPWAVESTMQAAIIAYHDGAHYLAVTNLQDEGQSYGANFPWRTFNSSTLAGAILMYENTDARIYCLVRANC